tara:strand:+ start:2533 stop:2736 length:204 start_codon:yes stop_codon:yes gene_type:complete
MKDQIAEANLTTLAHANELASKVIAKVAGEAVATTVNGEILTNNQIKHAVAAKMQACLITGEGGKKE